MKRREFCQWLGTGAGLTVMGCRSPADLSRPVPSPIEGLERVATTCQEVGDAGIVVILEQGRAVHVEGNPDHPLSGGTICARGQSALQGLYSAHRITQPRDRLGNPLTWKSALSQLREKMRAAQGRGWAVLTRPLSDTEFTWWSVFLAREGGGRLVPFAPFPESAMVLACERTFDRNCLPLIHLHDSDCVVSLGARFLETWGNPVMQAGQYAEIRTVRQGQRARHLHVSPRCSRTAANADHWIPCAPGTETALVWQLLGALMADSPFLSESEKVLCGRLHRSFFSHRSPSEPQLPSDAFALLLRALRTARRPLVLPAELPQLGHTPVEHHIAVLLLNQALGAIGRFFDFRQAKPQTRIPSHSAAANLFQEIRSGQVSLLLIHDLDPAFVLPPDIAFDSVREHVDDVVLLTDHINESVPYADLTIPIRHDLERWGEKLSYLGVDTLQQPVVPAPEGVPQVEDLLDWVSHDALQGLPDQSRFFAFLQHRWCSRWAVASADRADFWQSACRRGGHFEFQRWTEDVPLSANLAPDTLVATGGAPTGELTLSVHESERFGDGRFSDRSWLQELAHPVTGIVWDSWVEMAPSTADDLKVRTGDMVRISRNERSVSLPAFVSPLLVEGHLACATGPGHTTLAEPFCFGANPFALLRPQLSDANAFVAGPMAVTCTKDVGRTVPVILSTCIGAHDKTSSGFQFAPFPPVPSTDDPVFQSMGLAEYSAAVAASDATITAHENATDDSHALPRWGMRIDLNRCTGCGACLVACRAKYRLPTVGKALCQMGRDAAWISILRHWSKGNASPIPTWRLDFMPMMCQHCQDAPCVTHCPVRAAQATVTGTNRTDPDRCIGFRACVSACPYRVRKFGWSRFQHDDPTFDVLNPQGVVVAPGMTRNCTLCLDESGPNATSNFEHQTACQKACPSRAIEIFDWNEVSSKDPRCYRCLDQSLGTQPQVVYLKKVRDDG